MGFSRESQKIRLLCAGVWMIWTSWEMEKGAWEKTEELDLLIQTESLQKNFHNELTNCTSASLLCVNFEQHRASLCWGHRSGLQKMQ